MNVLRVALFGFAVLTAQCGWASSTLRCGSALVSVDDPASEVWDKCGAPVSRAQQGTHQVVDYYGGVHELQVEEWVYGPDHGMYQYLRMEGNRLVKIDSRRQQ